ncbi:class A beta-lactamase-related serine hydrolase [Amycolatopsis suaedae]|uniref:Class A beta-lactamase-related serine hydrolase n=2 Tax=Amycolatopsis suaedae TaxID=2510978 RepID=A0A4Q7J5R6_9PSEU|nr:class A beta-lactamase-related serine hydrolase [Amycolatopsis suaedae]
MLVAATLVTALATPAAATDRPTRVRAALDRLLREGFPGAVAYIRDGERVDRMAAGVADLATGEPATPEHRFRTASNTKAFTATVLLQLEGEGALSLDDTVERWLPGVVRGNGHAGSRITLRQLLNHTSGVYDPATTHEFFRPYLQEKRWWHVIRPREVVRRAMLHEPYFPPGTPGKVKYSNTNYLLAGLVIEKVTGRPAHVEIDRRILRPLELTETDFPIIDPTLHGRHLRGYDLADPPNDHTVFSPSYDWTAGAIVSTVDDLATFHRALLGGKLLKPAQQAKLTEVAGNYGLGVERAPLPCGTAWGNNGSGPGYYSFSLTSQDGQRQIVLALNRFDLSRDLDGKQAVPGDLLAPLDALGAALC